MLGSIWQCGSNFINLSKLPREPRRVEERAQVESYTGSLQFLSSLLLVLLTVVVRAVRFCMVRRGYGGHLMPVPRVFEEEMFHFLGNLRARRSMSSKPVFSREDKPGLVTEVIPIHGPAW